MKLEGKELRAHLNSKEGFALYSSLPSLKHNASSLSPMKLEKKEVWLVDYPDLSKIRTQEKEVAL